MKLIHCDRCQDRFDLDDLFSLYDFYYCDPSLNPDNSDYVCEDCLTDYEIDELSTGICLPDIKRGTTGMIELTFKPGGSSTLVN